jgi:MFS family permease
VTEKLTEKVTKESKSGYRSLFANRQFMSLWIAQVFSQFADRVVFVLFVAVLTANEHATIGGKHFESAQLTSLLYVAFTIPAVLLSPMAGVYVDRWSNKAVLVLSNLFRAACICLVATPYAKASPVAAFSLAFVVSIGSQFFAPAEASSIPRLVKKDELFQANSLFFTTMMIALGFGFAIGEPILAHTGIGKAPFAVAGAFILAAIFCCQITDNKPAAKSNEVWWEELRFGIAYIANNKMVFRAIVKLTFLFSTIIALTPISVGLTEQLLNLQAVQFGYVIAAAGIGMGIGNFVVGHYFSKVSAALLAYKGFILLGLFLTMLGSLGFLQDSVFPSIGMSSVNFHGSLIAVPLLIVALVGASCAFIAVPTQSLLQASVPEELRGKVFAAQNTAMSAASTIPAVLIGVSADKLPGGVFTTLLIIGLPTLLVGLHHHSQTSKEIASGAKLDEAGNTLE